MNENISVVLDNSPAISGKGTKLQSSVYIMVALTPALIWSCVYLGMRSLIITLVCMASCMIFETACQLILFKKTSVLDLSSAAFGMLIAFTFPVAVPAYIPIVSCFVSTVIVKILLGKYVLGIINPILISVLVTQLIWKEQTAPSYLGTRCLVNAENITDHLPITAIQNGDIPSESIFDLFFGNQTGNIGTISAAMLILGAVYLIAVKEITWHIPTGFLAAALIATYLMAPQGLELGYTVASICTGGVMYGAIFLSTYSFSCPITPNAKLVYGIGCGLITVFLRAKFGFLSDVALAILVMGAFSRILDALLAPKIFGKAK